VVMWRQEKNKMPRKRGNKREYIPKHENWLLKPNFKNLE
jgi:hypothetical protein